MIPIRDNRPTRHKPVVTWTLIALNVLVFLIEWSAGDAGMEAIVRRFGVVPSVLVEGQWSLPRAAGGAQGAWVTPLTSLFLHGGWLHLIGNMWFLHIFGDNVEDELGKARYLALYFAAGFAAVFAQAAVDPSSAVPMVGASGAIGGVMGAYIRLFPRARIHMLLVLGFYVTTAAVPAVWMLGYWFLVQLLGGLPQLAGFEGGVAFWAHVGGFVAGALLVGVFRSEGRMRARLALTARRTARYRI